jgi:hypothetical protein
MLNDAAHSGITFHNFREKYGWSKVRLSMHVIRKCDYAGARKGPMMRAFAAGPER